MAQNATRRLSRTLDGSNNCRTYANEKLTKSKPRMSVTSSQTMSHVLPLLHWEEQYLAASASVSASDELS